MNVNNSLLGVLGHVFTYFKAWFRVKVFPNPTFNLDKALMMGFIPNWNSFRDSTLDPYRNSYTALNRSCYSRLT